MLDVLFSTLGLTGVQIYNVRGAQVVSRSHCNFQYKEQEVHLLVVH